MKFILILLFLTNLTIQASEIRHWVTLDGRFFDAAFKQYKNGSVYYLDEKNKEVSIKLSNLSYVDRAHLMDNENVPEKDILMGAYRDPVEKVKLSSSDIKKLPSLKITGSGGSVSLEVTETPHFKIFAEKGIKIKDFAFQLERIWYLASLNNPVLRSFQENKKNAVLITESEEFHKKLLLHLSTLNPTVLFRGSNELSTTWNITMRSIRLTPEMHTSNDIRPIAFCIYLEKRDLTEQKNHIFFDAAYHRHLFNVNTSPISKEVYVGSARNIPFGLSFYTQLLYHDQLLMGFEQEGALVTGHFGSIKQWGKDLARLSKKEGLKNTIAQIFTEMSHDSTDIELTKVVASYMRFIHSSVGHQMGTVKFYALIEKSSSLPSLDEIAQCYGYKNLEEMDKAFKEFIETENYK